MNIQKAFLRDFEAIMKIHVSLQLANNMKNVLDQMKLILALSKWQKKVLKMTTRKSSRRTLHFAVTSRWPDTLYSSADEFMTPSCPDTMFAYGGQPLLKNAHSS